MLTKEQIVGLLQTDDRAVARALLVLNERQTQDEQASEHTRYLNGKGFRPCHARMGTSMAKHFLRFKTLTKKQINYWRVLDATGTMRIAIYWKQLLEAAEEKAKSKPVVAMATSNPQPVGRDLGNDMERKAHLEYELGMVLDSDDPAIIDPIRAEIDELDAFWAKLRKARP